ncbi:hypothetical protein [Marinilactibacillus psychrotolerans]|uniref:hypothetical protein n=1 Tax=Marinilactibacillus psychrotolerans TaxID=191770 RepID=UPI001C7D588D|nr:hypothetical protein [Marinilactibacillus psychrotolerans]
MNLLGTNCAKKLVPVGNEGRNLKDVYQITTIYAENIDRLWCIKGNIMNVGGLYE